MKYGSCLKILETGADSSQRLKSRVLRRIYNWDAVLGTLSSDAARPPGGASCAPELEQTEFGARELAILDLQQTPAECSIRLYHLCLSERIPRDGGATMPEGYITDLFWTARNLQLQTSHDAMTQDHIYAGARSGASAHAHAASARTQAGQRREGCLWGL